MVTCAWCYGQFHTTCCNIDRGPPLVFTCPTCRMMPSQIKTISTNMTLLINTVSKLSKSNEQLMELSRLRDTQYEKSLEDNRSLREQISKLTTDCNKLKWELMQGQDNAHPKKTVLVGSSIIRDIDPNKLIDTEVRSVSGGKVNDVLNIVRNSTSHVDQLITLVGSNDCAEPSREPGSVQDILSIYDELITVAKTKARNVAVSSICPRLNADKAQECIDALNTGLQELCTARECDFINQSASFQLGDGSVNDGYFINDGVHLNRQGTNRIAKNLKLKVKDDIKDISKPYKARPTSPRSSNSRPQRLPQSNGLTARAAEDTSRPAHTNDWTRVNGRNRRHWHAQGPERNSGNEQFRRNQRHKFEMDDFQHKRQPASDTQSFSCYFCGEGNHNMDTCRWRSPVVCHLCKKEGHKQKHCPEYDSIPVNNYY